MIDMVAQLAAKRIAHFVWDGSGLDSDEAIDGATQKEYAETMQRIIEGTGPTWVLDAIPE